MDQPVPEIANLLTMAGTPLGRFRASRRMKLLGLVSSQPPAHKYKKAGQPHVRIPNQLNWQFDVQAPNQVWAGDIIFIWTGGALGVSSAGSRSVCTVACGMGLIPDRG